MRAIHTQHANLQLQNNLLCHKTIDKISLRKPTSVTVSNDRYGDMQHLHRQ